MEADIPKEEGSAERGQRDRDQLRFDQSRARCPGVLAVVVVCAGLALGSLLSLPGSGARASLVSKAVPATAVPASAFSVRIPGAWTSGERLRVKLPHGNVLVKVPAGLEAGQSFVLRRTDTRHTGANSGMPSHQALPKARKALQHAFEGDLTSLTGMLRYERRLRARMGKLKNRWPTGLQMPQSTMLTHKFIPVEEAPDAEGWDPTDANGFPAGPPDANNTNGVPGYTYTTNGEDVGVDDEGPGYYQPQDPEHWSSYQKLLRFDCFTAAGQPWRDHSNCAALVKRSHTYPNADMFRFSGAFGWNPPFPPGPRAHNKQGAQAPDPQEYWNYGSDQDFADAARWDGKAFPPPEEEEKAPATTLESTGKLLTLAQAGAAVAAGTKRPKTAAARVRQPLVFRGHLNSLQADLAYEHQLQTAAPTAGRAPRQSAADAPLAAKKKLVSERAPRQSAADVSAAHG